MELKKALRLAVLFVVSFLAAEFLYSLPADGRASNRETVAGLLKAVGEIVWKVAAERNGGRA